MKQKITDFILIFFSFLSLIFIFLYNKDVTIIILDAINLFFKRVFVSLFPMFILNDLFIALNIPYYFYKAFNSFFQKLFKTSGTACYVFIMSLFSGTPSNAYIITELLEQNKISLEEANHYLYFTYFSNPLFLVSMLSLSFSKNIVIKVILIHYISNIIIGILLRNKAPIISNSAINFTHQNIFSTIPISIKKSINTLFMILGTIVFYMLISYIITSIIPTGLLLKTILSGFFEITNGLNTLAKLSINSKIKEIIVASIISFGGLSIHTQIKSILEDTSLSYSYFLKGRIYQAIISVILIFIF